MRSPAEPTASSLLLDRASDNRPALYFRDATWTWRQYVRRCQEHGAWLSELAERRLPRTRGDGQLHVGALVGNTPEMLFLIGGAALAGQVVVALDSTRTADELARDIERTRCDILVTEGDACPRAIDLATAAGLPLFDMANAGRQRAARDALDGFRPAAVHPDTPLLLVFTPGATTDARASEGAESSTPFAEGRGASAAQRARSASAQTNTVPNALLISHRRVTWSGAAVAAIFRLGPSDVVYCPMPLARAETITSAFAPALHAAAPMALSRRFSAPAMLNEARRHDCTYLHYIGSALAEALTVEPHPDDSRSPLRVASGSGASPEVRQRFAQRYHCDVVDLYGSRETGIWLAPDPAAPPEALGRLTEGVAVLHPRTGEACPPAHWDVSGHMLNADQAIGELVNTAGTGLFGGYYDNPAATAERVQGGMFFSGDLAYHDADGYVYFVGGADNWRGIVAEHRSART